MLADSQQSALPSVSVNTHRVPLDAQLIVGLSESAVAVCRESLMVIRRGATPTRVYMERTLISLYIFEYSLVVRPSLLSVSLPGSRLGISR